MIRWIPYSFVRTVLFFMGGILLGLYAPDVIPESVSWILVAAMSVLYILIYFLGRRIRHTLNPGWVALPLVFLLGYIHLLAQTESRDPNHLLNNHDPVSYYQAIITRFPDEKARSWRSEARVLQIHSKTWQPKAGKIVLYFSKEDFKDPFRYGDVLLLKGQPQVPETAANPGEFDYRQFLALKNIYHQHFLRSGDVVKTDHAPPSVVMDFAFRGREWAEATLRNFVQGSREQAFASALVLGVTDGLDNELLNAYAATGTMHVLAVSGLHVSILYVILLWILSPLNKIRGGPWWVAIAALMTLWLYAFVTGLSPSVLRAVAMFSFLAVGKPWLRSTNVYNTLAVSAFFLLVFDPFLIRSVGFQLSYLAVSGIVLLYPRIITLWEPKQWLLTEIWKISAVSIAAQIFTFPLGLLYFHQFPNYFLLSNLLVVPLSFVVLILGLLVLVVSFFSVAAVGFGIFLGWVIQFLNFIVFGMEKFPFSLVEDVYIDPWQCGLLIAFILAGIALFQYRKFKYAVVSAVILLPFVTLQWYHFAQEVNLKKITVYKVPGHSVIDLIDRGHSIFLADQPFREDQQKIKYHVSPNRLLSGIRSVNTDIPASRSLKGCTLIHWNGKKILQVMNSNFELPGPLTVDLLIIGNNALSGIKSIPVEVAFKKVILDSSNSFFFASRFLEEAKLYKLDVHSVLHQGAFVLTIENQDNTWSI